MVCLVSRGYQESQVLLESLEWLDHLVKEDYLDLQDYLELVNLEKTVFEDNQDSLGERGRWALLDYQGVQACQAMENQAFLDQRVTRVMLVSLDLQD